MTRLPTTVSLPPVAAAYDGASGATPTIRARAAVRVPSRFSTRSHRRGEVGPREDADADEHAHVGEDREPRPLGPGVLLGGLGVPAVAGHPADQDQQAGEDDHPPEEERDDADGRAAQR